MINVFILSDEYIDQITSNRYVPIPNADFKQYFHHNNIIF